MVPPKLVARYLSKHPVRSLLTLGSMVVAIFLLCMLRSLIVALHAGVEAAKSNRLWVQSAVSLFVEMPISYQPKIAELEGVETTCKWQWFGGYYQDPGQFFAQFAVDEETLFELYPEIDVVEGSREAFLGQRTACIIGEALAKQFDWKVGDRIPLIGGIFPHPEGDLVPWEFDVAGIYVPRSSSIDNRTVFFHWDYFQKSLEEGSGYTPGMGTVVLRSAPGIDQPALMRSIEGLFENGPQRVQTFTEAEFQSQFVSMVGNVPFFVNSIGSGVLIAILLACVNTMLMAFRQETRDIGVLKALGFTDGDTFALMLLQSLALCLLGGALGIGVAVATQRPVVGMIGTMFPGYAITTDTMLLGIALAAAIGILAGLVPALGAKRLASVEALRAV